MIDRRVFLASIVGGLLAARPVAGAHAAGSRQKVGYVASGGRARHSTEVFLGQLRELGYEQGRNLEFEFRSPADPRRVEQLQDLADELVKLNVDVLVAAGPPAAEAAQRATRSIPVVMVAVDNPVGRGLVASLARPGGNLTGPTWDVSVETYATKMLKTLKEVLPKSSRVAFLSNLDNPAAAEYVKAYQNIAPAMGLTLLVVGVSHPEQSEDALAQMVDQRVDAVIVGAWHMPGRHRRRIAELATRSRLPTICGWRKWIVAGCLLSYGPSPEDMYRRAADYVDKILRGAKPAELPIEQPTRFQLVINLKTAKTLGLAIPQSLLVRADEVIE